MTALRGKLGGSQHPRRHYFSRYNEWLKLPDRNMEPGADESNRPGRRLSLTDDMSGTKGSVRIWNASERRRRTEQRQGLRKFEDVYGRTRVLSRGEAALGVSERTFRRWRDRYEAEGAEGDRRPGQVSARRAGADEVAGVQAREAGRWHLQPVSTSKPTTLRSSRLNSTPIR